MSFNVSEKRFAELVDEAVASMPEEFSRHMENVSIDIQPAPTREFMRAMKLRGSPRNLLGLYHGVPLTEKSVSSPYEFPEEITIFQDNIEAICDSEAEIVAQVRRTVLHEIGHHFGMDEDELRRRGYG